jgi:hypothetical protein
VKRVYWGNAIIDKDNNNMSKHAVLLPMNVSECIVFDFDFKPQVSSSNRNRLTFGLVPIPDPDL